MLRKIKIMILLLTTLSMISVNVFSADKQLDNLLSIEQDNKKISAKASLYEILNKTFDIKVTNIKESDGIQIFISTDKKTINFSKGSIPLDDTDIFAYGNSVANEADEKTKEISLYFDSERITNYLSEDRRINQGDSAIVRVGGLGNEINTTAQIQNLYFIVFIDFNENKSIEKNEVIHFQLKIKGSGPLFTGKVYVSTIGYYVTNFKKQANDDYKLYKITNKSGLERFMKEVTNDIRYLEYLLNDDEASTFKKHNYYIIHSPVTSTLFLDQPYRYSDKKQLIFDVVPSSEQVNKEYIAARNYKIEKKQDILTIYVNDNGKLIVPKLHTY